MTQEEVAARKFRIYLVAGVGIAALAGSYAVGYIEPHNGRFALLLTAVFLICVFLAATMAFRLNKESASPNGR
jgi:predicted MFS family arabinose efflux permease